MRIISGEHRGRTLIAPEGGDTRPTTDRVRESIMSSLFSMLGGFGGVNVLDAFSGSGAMGLESMSRGAESCVLNDTSKLSREAISKNCNSMGYSDDRVRILSTDIMRFGFPRAPEPYSLVFLDPPYKIEPEKMLSVIKDSADAGILAPECIVVYEHGEKIDEETITSFGLWPLASKKFGKTYVTYIKWN